MPSKHARLSPSSADRWLHCPGCIALSEQCPDPGSSPYADAGTVAHSLGELKLRQMIHEIDAKTFRQEYKALQASEFYSGEMEEATDFYLTQVAEALSAAGDDAELMIEQQFTLDEWVPESFGTSDAVVIGIDGHMHVFDLKYGQGIRVEAENNPQLRLYGLGALSLFGELYEIDTVTVTIVQPRLDHVASETLAVDELLAWADYYVKPRAKAAAEGTEERESGYWCRWCPAKARCRTRAQEALSVARDDFREPGLLSEDEIAEVLKKAENVKRWVDDVQAYALAQALDGQQYKGWKLVEGRSVRKYADELKVAEALKGAGFDEALLYERKLYGITAMEKLVGKKKLAETLGELLIKPPGKPVLVPETDKREAISSADAARADFK